MKVLFFSSTMGIGHDQVAKTLASEFQSTSKDIEVQILDIVKTISPFLSRVMLESYIRLLKHAPSVWGLLHDQFSEPKEASDTLEFINNFLAQEVKERIQHFNPDLIVNTYALGSTIVGLLRRQKKISMPSATVITDYNLHSYWIDKNINKFYVASYFLKDILIDYGLKEDAIQPFGLPVRKTFLDAKERNILNLKKELSLEDKPTLLFMGGGLGLGDLLKIIKQADKHLENTQMILACGKNEDLKQKAGKMKLENTLVTLPYIENIAQYMQCSDIIVTKPGGITVTEAMILEKPLALISPIPGQESHNQSYLLNQGVAISLPTNKYAGIILSNLLKDDERLRIMSRLESRLVNQNAAKDIVSDLKRLALS
ncbi:MAG: MGDG synthase family glycosyltransferase [Clostridia bacterium]